MAGITFLCGHDVLCVFPCRDNAVVAARAGTEHLQMVYARDWGKHDRVVAVLTKITCGNMIGDLADRHYAVVAGKATVDNPHMIEERRDPGRSTVTVVAHVASGYMIDTLAAGDDAVVATGAGAEHL